MQEATVAFKVDFSDEYIKRKVMEAVSNFPGVTFVDIKEKGKLIVRGKFEQIEMGLELRKIDKSIVIGTKGTAKHNLFYQTVTSILHSGNVPNMQVSIIKVLDIRKANTVIWEFSGVTSVEYEGVDQIEVKGEFNILEMVEKLKKIGTYVSVLDAGSSSGPTVPERSKYSMPAAQPKVNQPPNKGAWSIPLPQFTLNKGAWNIPLPQFKQQGKEGGLFAGFGIKKQQPQINHPHQDFARIAEKLRNDEKAKADKARIEKDNADKKLRLDKEKADKARIEKDKADKKLRLDKEKADKARIEKDKADKKLRLDKEKAKKARIEKENAVGNKTGMQTAGTWLRTQVTGAIGSALGTANPTRSQQTKGFGFTQPTSTVNPNSTQQTRTTRSTLPSSTTNPSYMNH